MHSIAVLTFIATAFLVVQGFDQCNNPTDDGTRLTADNLCLWFCSQMCIKPLQGQNSWWTTTTSNLWATTTPTPTVRPWNQASNGQNFGQDYTICHKKCVNSLAGLATCEQTLLKQSLTNACPDAQSLTVCLASCGCCSTDSSTSNTCVQTCFRQSGFQIGNGQSGFQNQGFQNQGFQGQGRPNFQGNQNQWQPGTQPGFGSQNGGQSGWSNGVQNPGFQNQGQGFQGSNGYQGNQNQYQPGTQFGSAGSANGGQPQSNFNGFQRKV